MKTIDWNEITNVVCGLLAEAYGPQREAMEKTAKDQGLSVHQWIGLCLTREISVRIEGSDMDDD
ncbi:MAG: hypothetical protein SGI77_25475 [Pirellulaceae bacterium]|nr:hypothetical protein [Pirellulaceae bacterium]